MPAVNLFPAQLRSHDHQHIVAHVKLFIEVKIPDLMSVRRPLLTFIRKIVRIYSKPERNLRVE